MKDHLIFAGKVLAVLVVYKLAKNAISSALPESVRGYLP